MREAGIDVRVDVHGSDVRELLWGRPLGSVYVRQWVTFSVFLLVLLGTAVRFPSADALERYLLLPLLLVALAFTVLSLFIVRGAAGVRRRAGLDKLGGALVEHGIVRLDEVEAVRHSVRLTRDADDPDSWTATTVIDRDGIALDLTVDGDAGDEARVRLVPRTG